MHISQEQKKNSNNHAHIHPPHAQKYIHIQIQTRTHIPKQINFFFVSLVYYVLYFRPSASRSFGVFFVLTSQRTKESQ